MPVATLNPATGKQLRKLFGKLAESMRETLGSLVGKELHIQVTDLMLADATALVAGFDAAYAVVRGALDKDYAGRTLGALVHAADACTMAGHLMLTPDSVIEQRRLSGKLEGEDKEAFGELANVLCSGLSTTLRDQVTQVDLRLQDHGVIEPTGDAGEFLPDGELVVCTLALQVEGYDKSTAYLVTDRQTAEAWNHGVLDGALPASAATAATAEAPAKSVEDDLSDIPAAPIRGALHAYLTANDLWRTLRRSCRRVGLDLRRHSRAEAPNPAAHRGELVLMDVPLDEERRIDWCRRLKEFDPMTKVALILHRPSRARVAQAFHGGADLILGLPLDEPQLSAKLNALLGP